MKNEGREWPVLTTVPQLQEDYLNLECDKHMC